MFDPESRANQEPAEQRVFGNAFSLDTRTVTGEDALREYVSERIALIESGETTWLARTLDADNGVCADLFSQSAVVATLEFDYDDGAAIVYTTSEGGSFGDTTLCDRVPFDDAVEAAEQFVADLI